LIKHHWLQPAASDPNTNRLIPVVKTVKEKARQLKEGKIVKPPQILNLVYGSSGAPGSERSEKPEKMEKVEKMEKMEKAEKMEKVETWDKGSDEQDSDSTVLEISE